MVGDTIAVERKIQEAKNADYSFPNSRECTLIENLSKAISEGNGEDFATFCSDFDRISPLDPWKTTLLLRAKNHIAGADGDEGDLT